MHRVYLLTGNLSRPHFSVVGIPFHKKSYFTDCELKEMLRLFTTLFSTCAGVREWIIRFVPCTACPPGHTSQTIFFARKVDLECQMGVLIEQEPS